ncbi:fimbrial protein [Mediterranea massiliensis]|uniref:fimbrial protein n=1 Tax=Mediterranea massiliensis TaxID=1841865 RepID=UPI0023F1A20C|nr:fimbrial protein [Mediterranea massiliensis]
MDKKQLLNSIVFGLLALAVVACTDEADGVSNTTLHQGEVALQWLAPNMGIQHVTTRGSDPKTAAEQEINNVHVFVFGENGEYLQPNQEDGTSDAFQGYQYVGDGKNLVLQSSMFEQTNATNAIIVAVANVPENIFGELEASGHPKEIANLKAFNDFVFNLPTFTATLPEGGLPMIGVAEGVNLSSSSNSGNVVLVQMKSLMARIDLDFTMDPYQSSDDRQNPSLRFDKVSVGNFPSGGTVNPQLDPEIREADGNPAAAIVTGNKEGTIKLNTLSDVSVPDFTGHVLRAKEPQSLTLYMFEHARAAKAFTYPSGIKDEEKQRYKNKLADEEAAYIQLKGIYTNHNGYKYAVIYTLYPGANAVDDFTIKHNRQYKHNITVKGITVNNMGEEALLDTRVDIDSEENPYFIEMLREREHDAHFNVTPMDVYIYEPGTVTVKIVGSEDGTQKAPDWIRMEPMKYSPTAGSKVKATIAGEGKRDYFTEGLMDELRTKDNLDGTINGQKYSLMYKVDGSTSSTEPYEERIYFYIDENVPGAPYNTAIKNGDIVPEREAWIKITYQRQSDYNTHVRYIPIRQAGMLPVEFESNDRRTYTFYIEYYEEYLSHYDGKNEYNDTYDGLEWGFTGIMTGLGGTDGNKYIKYGWRNTMQIMQKFRENTTIDKWEMMLNDKPRGAAEYCYNKNKRNESTKRVDVCHWFQPCISEMEQAMTKYYGTFRVFQNEWYWSSNPGPWGENGGDHINKLTWSGEHENYARAVKMNYAPGTQGADANGYVHATSEADKPYAKDENGKWDTPYTGRTMGVSQEGEGGYARRNLVFRIRAAYIHEMPDGMDTDGSGRQDPEEERTLDNTRYYQ